MSTREPQGPQGGVRFFYASDGTRGVYGPTFDDIGRALADHPEILDQFGLAHAATTAKILILRRSDFDVPITEQNAETWAKRIFVDSGFIGQNCIDDMGGNVIPFMYVVNHKSKTEQQSMVPMPTSSCADGHKTKINDFDIIFMLDAPSSIQDDLALVAGLRPEDIRPDISGDNTLEIGAHEVGHALANSVPASHPGVTGMDETGADAFAYGVYRAARGLDDGYMEAFAHARAIGALQPNGDTDPGQKPSNLSLVNDHATTLGGPVYYGEDNSLSRHFNPFGKPTQEAVYIPLMVASVAHAVAGAASQDTTEPGPWNLDDRVVYYTDLGEKIKGKHPQLLYAAVQAADFGPLEEQLKSPYREVLRRVVEGYTAGVQAITQGVVDLDLVQRMVQQARSEDFRTLACRVTEPMRDAALQGQKDARRLPEEEAFQPEALHFGPTAVCPTLPAG